MRKTLLLGAGFSKNFGGFLAEDIFLRIFNHFELSDDLKDHLMKFISTSDVEQFYEEKKDRILHKILTGIFKEMDSIFKEKIESQAANNRENFSYLSVIGFVSNFSYSSGGSGYVFSLNQDLLLERLFVLYLESLKFHLRNGCHKHSGCLLPLYGPISTPFYNYHSNDKRQLDRLDQATKDAIQNWKIKFNDTYEKENREIPCLIKLHGSYFWQPEDGEALCIWGTRSKKENIQSVPILALYMDKFKEIMEKANELYVIGYSFKDDHINEIISNSCEIGTRLIVVDVMPLNKWLKEIEKQFKKTKKAFSLKWLKRYHNSSFQDLFPILPCSEKTFFENVNNQYDYAINKLKTETNNKI